MDGTPRPGMARLNGDTLVTWAAGDASDKTISLPIINDSLLEGDESLTLTLTPITGGATLGVNPTATLTIVDDDISLSAVSGTGIYNGTATLKASLMSGSGGASGKNINFTFNGNPAGSAITDASGVATLTGISLAGINAGSYPSAVAASFAGDAIFSGSNSSGPLLVAKADQTLTVTTHAPASVAYNSQFSVAATASSGLAVTYSASGNCNNAGAIFTITNGSGTCTVKYDQPGNNNYNSAPQATETVNAKKARQAISINTNAPASAAYSSQFTVAATASSGLTVTYSAAGSCTNSGGLFTMTGGTGTCTVKYDQAGDSNNEPADQLTQTVNAQKINQAITFGALSNRALGDADFSVSATTDAVGLTVSFAASGQCTVSGSTVHLTGAGTCTITASQAGDGNYNAAASVGRSFTINPPPSPTVALGGATYLVGEGAGSLSVTVNRTGDTTTAVAVDYATSDTAGLTPCNVNNGVASSRCDYATTVGTLHFAAGESSQTISIPLVDDGYMEGAETFTVKLSNPVGASLGATSSSTIIITDNDATASNPIVGVPYFVRQQYIDFLGREPDPGGFVAWQSILNNCAAGDTSCDRIAVSSGFFRSQEFQTRGYFIYKFYSAVLGRKPSYAEFMPDLAKVSGFLGDAQLEANKVAFVQEFMTRAEYVNRYGSLGNTAFVDTLIQTAGLQSHPMRDAWVGRLDNGSATKAEVLRAFTESLEVYNKFYNEAFVRMQYFGYLRRDPDASYQTWIQTMNTNGGDYRAMISGFINSNEYVQRFGP